MSSPAPKNKMFRDSVHGYISIPDDVCQSFINTEVFQRLRHIEQTSMRVLYPSARHDRFVHSLGVYYLGRYAFCQLLENASEVINNLKITAGSWEKVETSFTLACLLHDCGHAPFSHTFEDYYDIPKRPLDKTLLDLMKKDKAFAEDYENCSPSSHEKVSGIMVMRRFRDEIISHGGDAKLVVRMIVGCLFHATMDRQKQLNNCLIQLLNGKAIDVDKLDYIIRDTWASGVNNTSIDVHRLLGALTICEHNGRLELAFRKSALSVVQSVVSGRNFIYQWIYVHHKVLYDQFLLKEAVKKLGRKICKDPDKFLHEVFSVKALQRPVNIEGHIYYLPTDGDLIYSLKCYMNKIPEAKEWITRKHLAKALWKTYAEYNDLFSGISDTKRKVIRKKSEKALSEFQHKIKCKKFIIIDAKAKISKLLRDELYIMINDKPCSYHPDIDGASNESERVPPYFYIYVPEDAYMYRNEIISLLCNLS